MYFCSEICTATLKYVLLHQNIYCHSEICYPVGMHTLANHHHTVHYGHRLTNESITASYRPTSSYRPHTGFSPCATACTHPGSMSKTFAGSRWVSPAANGPPTCSPIAQRPAMCPHRVPPSTRIYQTVAHGRLSRCHVTATLHSSEKQSYSGEKGSFYTSVIFKFSAIFSSSLILRLLTSARIYPRIIKRWKLVLFSNIQWLI